MTTNLVHGWPLDNGPLEPLGEWAMLSLQPISDRLGQHPPEIKEFTIAADRNGITVMYSFEGATHHWLINFDDGNPTFRRVDMPEITCPNCGSPIMGVSSDESEMRFCGECGRVYRRRE
jgi:hypothetical protein